MEITINPTQTMKLTPAEDWADKTNDNRIPWIFQVRQIRQIQADALRAAADSIHREPNRPMTAFAEIMDTADKLHPKL